MTKAADDTGNGLDLVTHRRALTFVALALCALIMLGCGSQDSESSADGDAGEADPAITVAGPEGDPLSDEADGTVEADQTTAGQTTSTTEAGVDPSTLSGDQLITYLAARYRDYWFEYDQARRTPSASPETDASRLGDLAAGEQLESSFASIKQLFEAGEALRDPAQAAVEQGIRVRVELTDESLAEIYGCLVNDDERVIAATGEVVSGDVRSVASQTTMAWTDGDWKVIRSQASAIEPGVAGCWLEGADVYPD